MFTLISLIGFTLTLVLTWGVRRFALSQNIVDDPKGVERKIHSKPKPLLGGVAIYLGLCFTIFLSYLLELLPQGSISGKQLIGLLFGGAWLILGGVLDDKYNFSPKKQILFPLLAVLTVISSGIGIESFTNPFGGQFFLDQFEFTLFSLKGIPYSVTLLADVFTFLWLFGFIYATKFFDGLDGLVSGITVIGAFTVFATSLLPKVNQPETALLALIVASCFAGFLFFNFNPASIFLGEAGSTLAGFLIGSLAIIAESKITTTLVVMSLPLLDLLWTVVRRTFLEKTSPTKADRKHIHHRLLDSGLSHRSAVFLLYLWAIGLGIVAWLYQSTELIELLFLSFVFLISFAIYLIYRIKKYA